MNNGELLLRDWILQGKKAENDFQMVVDISLEISKGLTYLHSLDVGAQQQKFFFFQVEFFFHFSTRKC